MESSDLFDSESKFAVYTPQSQLFFPLAQKILDRVKQRLDGIIDKSHLPELEFTFKRYDGVEVLEGNYVRSEKIIKLNFNLGYFIWLIETNILKLIHLDGYRILNIFKTQNLPKSFAEQIEIADSISNIFNVLDLPEDFLREVETTIFHELHHEKLHKLLKLDSYFDEIENYNVKINNLIQLLMNQSRYKLLKNTVKSKTLDLKTLLKLTTVFKFYLSSLLPSNLSLSYQIRCIAMGYHELIIKLCELRLQNKKGYPLSNLRDIEFSYYCDLEMYVIFPHIDTFEEIENLSTQGRYDDAIRLTIDFMKIELEEFGLEINAEEIIREIL